MPTLTGAQCRPDGGRCEIYLKREDLNHTGAHKINNSLGQVLLCKRMGKQRIIAETGAGQHGVATVRGLLCTGLHVPASEAYFRMWHAAQAVVSWWHVCGSIWRCGHQATVFVHEALLLLQATVCAKFGLKCIVYMGSKVSSGVRCHELTCRDLE